MSSVNDEASLQPKEGDAEFQDDQYKLQGIVVAMGIDVGFGQAVHSLRQLKKSFEILKSALEIITSNTKFMSSMILSILPFFVFMFFHEIKLQKSITYVASNTLGKFVLYFDDYSSYDDIRINFLSDALQLSVFYVFFYPLLEFFSMIFTTTNAVKIHAGEKPVTNLREVFYQKSNLKGPFVTYLCVHLLSTITVSGLIWAVTNHLIFSRQIDYFDSEDFRLNILSVTVHSVIFLALLYKYIEWSALWNMSIVISVLEEESGIAAFEMSGEYGKLCKKTGFGLMLGFFVFSNVLRLPCLYAGLRDGSVAGVLVTCIAIMLVSLGNLVKWVAFVLYFYDCKEQKMDKKVDDQELGKSVKTASS